MAGQTVTLIIGDTISETITLYQPDGITKIGDISGGSVRIRIVTNLDDELGDAIYDSDSGSDVTLNNPADSEADWEVARSVTKEWTAGQYFWEVQYIDSSSNYSHTDQGICILQKSIYSGD